MNKRGFASDNNSGVHPAILEAFQQVNNGHVVGYGNDCYTEKAIQKFKAIFGDKIDVFFVFNGTGANVLSIATLTNSFNSVLSPSTAHIMVDECGAPEKISGCKLIPIETNNGKITPNDILPYLHGFDFEHHSQPKLISISQVTELGTVYTIDEIKAISNLAHEHGMYVHMDGARIANAAATLNLPFNEFTGKAGVDVLSFGGTKNGMMMGEAVVFFNKELALNTKYYRKQSGQLFSKMRYVAAQFLAYFENDLWKSNALHANNMAKILAENVSKLNITSTQKVDANGVFAIIDDEIRDKLQKEFFFYPWDENTHEVRWMTSFDTKEEDIEKFCSKLKELLNV
ncbi:MAG: low specificity L-threonine aldolase [Prolixibacteraceae bacterium]|jgi:threonine aldolase|nr:low specificity L-threonine aldolase [Prolixibacteraceae bacterium]